MWAFAGVSIVVMLLRILAKIRIRKLGWDDILMTFALVSAFSPLETGVDNSPRKIKLIFVA
jgi:hypothetical protein